MPARERQVLGSALGGVIVGLMVAAVLFVAAVAIAPGMFGIEVYQ